MHMRKLCTLLVLAGTIFFTSVTFKSCKSRENTGRWQSPPEAEKLKSPFAYDLVSEEKGRGLYNMYCRSCHGESGLGDGPAGKDLIARPSNFHSNRVKGESDGS